ncbi:hypothetical protein VTL71DRAFT_6840 [Oculimacula yallundae]|uniref:Uncharacterized protein n=1 Tax=Oculimacula yallundae TaxID=86028 RepID=A0ABR4BXK6_9HELO
MFQSCLSSKEHIYAPVDADSDDAQTPISKIRNNKSSRKRDFLRALIILEALHILLLLVGYGAVKVLSPHVHRKNELDTYFDLYSYNSHRSFYGDWKKMSPSIESDTLLAEIQESDGVVAIDTQWALQHGYSPSFVYPEDETKSIYQIDMFHSMHCVYRIRNKLTSNLTLEQWPRDDEHTLHCLDYLREQLMCNADLTLEGTDDLLHFNKTSGHICRSNEAIVQWASEYHWSGHREYLLNTTGYA